MSLHVHRSTDLCALVDLLGSHLSAGWADPFEAVPIVVGSRGMERWVRHELATRLDVVANVVFPTLRGALEGATAWVLEPGDHPAGRAWWDVDKGPTRGGWQPAVLASRVVSLLRARCTGEQPLLDQPAFAQVREYLAPPRSAGLDPDSDTDRGAVSYRELHFARQVADVLVRLGWDRPDEALAWARAPEAAPEQHRWLAALLQKLGAAEGGAPAAGVEALARLEATSGPGASAALVFRLFGPSFLTPGEILRLQALGRHAEVHVYAWSAWEAGPAGEKQNPVGRSLGGPLLSLDRLERLATARRTSVSAGQPAPPSPTLLGLLQHDVHRDHPTWTVFSPSTPSTPSTPGVGDDCSIRFHAAHGPLREVEILRDTLLNAFLDDETLQSRDVLVMTPDLATYAPLVAAVFAERLDSAASPPPASPPPASPPPAVPRIPVAIADLGLTHTNPVAAALLAILRMVEDRITAPDLADLLAMMPVRLRYGITPEDMDELPALMTASAMTWGLDEADRATALQPAVCTHTLSAGVERLALGVLMPDDDPLLVVSGASKPDRPIWPVSPLTVHGADSVHRVGVLASVVRSLEVLRAQLKGATMPMAAWPATLVGILDTFTEVSAAQGWLRAAVVDAIDELVQPEPAEAHEQVETCTIRRVLQGRFEIQEGGDRLITGAVTMSELQPMRGVPYRFVALLGMGDAAFPRGGSRPAWDPFDTARPDELDARAIDRGLLLEALLSTTGRLHVSWPGFDAMSGAEIAAAVPVEELIDAVGAMTGRERRGLVCVHPLQPWSPDPLLSSFDDGVRLAGQALQTSAPNDDGPGSGAAVTGLAACLGQRLGAEPAVQELSIRELHEALVSPQKALLYRRLRIYLHEEGEDALVEREALDCDGLDAWSWAGRALAAVDACVPFGEVTLRIGARLAGEGRLPRAAEGEMEARVEDALVLAERAAWVAGRRIEAPLLAADVGGVVVFGRPPRALEREGRLLLEWVHPGNVKDKYRLDAWLHLLVASAAGLPVDGARILARNTARPDDGAAGVFLAAPAAETARELLAGLLEVRAEARRAPIPLFEGLSPLIAAGWSPTRAPGGLESDVWRCWYGKRDYDLGRTVGAERDNTWVKPLFGAWDPLAHLDDAGSADLVALAMRVWSPVIVAALGGESLAATWAFADPPDEAEQAT